MQLTTIICTIRKIVNEQMVHFEKYDSLFQTNSMIFSYVGWMNRDSEYTWRYLIIIEIQWDKMCN